jgi:hypothetical protein
VELSPAHLIREDILAARLAARKFFSVVDLICAAPPVDASMICAATVSRLRIGQQSMLDIITECDRDKRHPSVADVAVQLKVFIHIRSE